MDSMNDLLTYLWNLLEWCGGIVAVIGVYDFVMGGSSHDGMQQQGAVWKIGVGAIVCVTAYIGSQIFYFPDGDAEALDSASGVTFIDSMVAYVFDAITVVGVLVAIVGIIRWVMAGASHDGTMQGNSVWIIVAGCVCVAVGVVGNTFFASYLSDLITSILSSSSTTVSSNQL